MTVKNDPCLVLDLPLHEADGLSLASRAAAGGTCAVTGAVWTPRGRSFDGVDDRIAGGTAPNGAGGAGLTLEVWLNAAAFTGYDTVIGGYYTTNYEFGCIAGVPYWDLAGVSWHPSGPALSLGDWHHLVGTWDGAASRLYINGNRYAATTTVPAAPLNTSGTVDIGRRQAGGQQFQGLIGEVRVYRRALVHDEIRRRFLAAKWRYR
jgi:MSHA biogenesis protein MshQ